MLVLSIQFVSQNQSSSTSGYGAVHYQYMVTNSIIFEFFRCDDEDDTQLQDINSCFRLKKHKKFLG